MIDVRRLAHATLTTPDLDRQVAYYTEVIGLTLLDRGARHAVLASKQGLEAIALDPGPRNALAQLAFQVAPGRDLADVAGALSEHGIKSERRSDISPALLMRSFSEIPMIPISKFSPSIAFPPRIQRQSGSCPSSSVTWPIVCATCRPWSSSIPMCWGFASPTGLTIVSPSYAAGRTITASISCTTTCRSCITSHSRSRIGRRIQRACEWLAKNGILLVWGPGRHIIGHNIAIYHRNADKVRVEFFCEMDQMKDEALGYFDSAPVAPGPAQRPKVWGPDTLRNYWDLAPSASSAATRPSNEEGPGAPILIKGEFQTPPCIRAAPAVFRCICQSCARRRALP